MIDPKDDGVSHINIYSKAQTEIGRWLSNFSDCNVATEDGNFRTIEGYWYWLSVKDDRLRKTNGFESKKLGRELRAPDWVKDPVFYQKISYAIIVKILSSEWAKAQLIQTGKLPLFHYYVYGHKVNMVKEGLWIVKLIDDLRTELIEGRI
jgi:hypothetical protein